MTTSSALRSAPFLILAATNFCCCAAHSGPIFHTVSYAIACGVAPLAAVSIYSLEGFTGMGGRLAFGVLGDRLGAKPVLVAGLLIQAFGALAYMFVGSLDQFYAVAALFGFTYAGVMPLYAVLARENFPSRMMGAIIGGTSTAGSLGMALGPLAGGWIYDAYATYAWLYLGSFGIGLGAFLKPFPRIEAAAPHAAGLTLATASLGVSRSNGRASSSKTPPGAISLIDKLCGERNHRGRSPVLVGVWKRTPPTRQREGEIAKPINRASRRNCGALAAALRRMAALSLIRDRNNNYSSPALSLTWISFPYPAFRRADGAPKKDEDGMRVSMPHGSTERNTDLRAHYRSVREASRRLGAPLSDADATVQSMPDASPAKWHLAHTTWFFETMILEQSLPGYRAFDPQFNFLFNSYYESIGARQPRPRRGMLTRPTLERVYAYRDHVDRAMASLMGYDVAPAVAELIELGCNHEQQHQELLLTDILHLFAQSPLRPAYKDPGPIAVGKIDSLPADYRAVDGGVIEIGHDGDGFAFDCEGPRHRALIEPFELADRLVTNGEWMEFMADGGYRTPLLWLSAGWATVQSEGWTAPLYWDERDDGYWSMTLRGSQPVDPAAPVTHVSYYEADAFATWAGRRLPSEFEWEHAARAEPLKGNFVDSGRLRPAPAQAGAQDCVRSTAMSGSGRAAPSRPIRAFGRRQALLANTTASSCAGNSSCAAARA